MKTGSRADQDRIGWGRTCPDLPNLEPGFRIPHPPLRTRIGHRICRSSAHHLWQHLNRIVRLEIWKEPWAAWVCAPDFHGVTGDVIRVRASDDFRVVSVELSIHSIEDRTVLESGCGILDPERGVWLYETSRDYAAGTSVGVDVTAADRPGNIARKLIHVVLLKSA